MIDDLVLVKSNVRYFDLPRDVRKDLQIYDTKYLMDTMEKEPDWKDITFIEAYKETIHVRLFCHDWTEVLWNLYRDPWSGNHSAYRVDDDYN